MFLASSHVGIVYNFEDNTQKLLQGHVGFANQLWILLETIFTVSIVSLTTEKQHFMLHSERRQTLAGHGRCGPRQHHHRLGLEHLVTHLPFIELNQLSDGVYFDFIFKHSGPDLLQHA